MTTLSSALTGVLRLGLDTAPIIYYIEEHPTYLPILAPTFAQVDAGSLTTDTSTITVAEVSVMPLRQSRPVLQIQYLDLLLHSVNFATVPIDADIAQTGASLRANHNIRLPDALQIAAAMLAGADAFLTNDHVLKRITAIKIIVLSERES